MNYNFKYYYNQHINKLLNTSNYIEFINKNKSKYIIQQSNYYSPQPLKIHQINNTIHQYRNHTAIILYNFSIIRTKSINKPIAQTIKYIIQHSTTLHQLSYYSFNIKSISIHTAANNFINLKKQRNTKLKYNCMEL